MTALIHQPFKKTDFIMQRRTLMAALLIVSLLWSSAPVVAAATGIGWQDFEPGLALGRDQSRKIFLYFYTDWCNYCKEMEKNTFSDPAVIAFLNNHFVAIRVNAERNAAAASRYSVRALPVSWFMAADGTRLSSLPGYVPAERLMLLLRFVQSESFKRMSLKEFAQQAGGG